MPLEPLELDSVPLELPLLEDEDLAPVEPGEADLLLVVELRLLRPPPPIGVVDVD